LKKHYGLLNSQIDIFEKNKKIGGRVKTVEFDNENVIAGAGIGRKKDKLLFKLCNELKVSTKIYQSNISYTFDELNILNVVEFLKTKINSEILEKRHLITFKKFATSILGKKLK
jgi:protoporphyrinogen oxidase